jgi:hypothetical protein
MPSRRQRLPFVVLALEAPPRGAGMPTALSREAIARGAIPLDIRAKDTADDIRLLFVGPVFAAVGLTVASPPAARS